MRSDRRYDASEFNTIHELGYVLHPRYDTIYDIRHDARGHEVAPDCGRIEPSRPKLNE